MKQFNINDNIYIEITEEGWEHLRKTVGQDYINFCILTRRYEINGVEMYRLQCWSVFDLLTTKFGSQPLFKSTILISEEHLK